MGKFSQKHAQYAFSSALKQQKCHKIWKKQSAKQKSAKNKPKNKQLASLEKNRNSTKN